MSDLVGNPEDRFLTTRLNYKSGFRECIIHGRVSMIIVLNLNLNSLLVKRQIDNPSPGAVTGGN